LHRDCQRENAKKVLKGLGETRTGRDPIADCETEQQQEAPHAVLLRIADLKGDATARISPYQDKDHFTL
jgi:hypothetical protein